MGSRVEPTRIRYEDKANPAINWLALATSLNQGCFPFALIKQFLQRLSSLMLFLRGGGGWILILYHGLQEEVSYSPLWDEEEAQVFLDF